MTTPGVSLEEDHCDVESVQVGDTKRFEGMAQTVHACEKVEDEVLRSSENVERDSHDAGVGESGGGGYVCSKRDSRRSLDRRRSGRVQRSEELSLTRGLGPSRFDDEGDLVKASLKSWVLSVEMLLGAAAAERASLARCWIMLETERPSVRGWAALGGPRRCSLPLHCEAARRAAFAILGGRSSTDGCLVVTRGDRRAEASVARLLLGEGLRDSFWL